MPIAPPTSTGLDANEESSDEEDTALPDGWDQRVVWLSYYQ